MPPGSLTLGSQVFPPWQLHLEQTRPCTPSHGCSLCFPGPQPRRTFRAARLLLHPPLPPPSVVPLPPHLQLPLQAPTPPSCIFSTWSCLLAYEHRQSQNSQLSGLYLHPPTCPPRPHPLWARHHCTMRTRGRHTTGLPPPAPPLPTVRSCIWPQQPLLNPPGPFSMKHPLSRHFRS